MIATVRAAAASVAGALGFLTQVPVGRSAAAWSAFADRPAAAVVAGYVVGALAALVVAATAATGLPAPTAAFAYLLALYALVGVNNLDGVADCGDAAVVHGDSARRLEVLSDTTTGVGAIAAVALLVAGLALGALAAVGLPALAAAAVVLAAEVGARVGLAGLAAVATAPHDGLGSELTAGAGPPTLVAALVLAVPAVTWPLAVDATSAGASPLVAAAGGAVVGALAATGVVGAWARSRLGGANGDVFGAATELARVVGLHAGVMAWTLS